MSKEKEFKAKNIVNVDPKNFTNSQSSIKFKCFKWFSTESQM